MVLTTLDWFIVGAFFILVLTVSLLASKSAGRSKEEFFLAGKSMPWWLLGFSMVATTFSADTPNLVTGFVREGGVAKNWYWWSFLITGMVTVFIYSKLWRRAGLLTDLEFYEMRYGGKPAAFLRGFRAVYLGLFFNCLIIGSVMLAGIKIAAILLGLNPFETVVISSLIVALYSAIGGIKGVIWTDFFQFLIALVGAVYAAHVALNHPKVGGWDGLFSNEEVQARLSFMPDFSNTSLLISMLIIPLSVQWWSVWYPGAEPGGGGYIAQRMLAAKSESHAIAATFFFNFAHYAVRPWPWIIVALASVVVFPDLASIRHGFPKIIDQYLGDDIAYPAMLTFLSPGWLGLVVASLISAFMSTVSTHLNWGSSYLVHDLYGRFVRQNASEKELVNVGRLATVLLMTISAILALTIMENANQAFNILLLSGAGTGAIFLLRWFWPRINAWTEISGMISATVLAFILTFGVDDKYLQSAFIDPFSIKLLIATFITTLVWVLTTLFTKPEHDAVLQAFAKKTTPMKGWSRFDIATTSMRFSMIMVFVGTLGIYAALFAVGNLICGNLILGFVLLSIFTICIYLIYSLRSKI